MLADFLHALIVDPRSQRALDETLVDARDEIAEARTIAGRSLAAARGGAAVARIFAGGFGREFRHLQVFRIGAVMLVSLVIPYLFTYRYLAGSLDDLSVHSPQRLVLISLVMIGSIAFFAPLSGFAGGVAAAKWRAAPLALAALLTFGEFAMVGWIVPESFQLYRQQTYARLAPPADRDQELPRGAAEKSLIALLSPATDLEARQARQQLQTRGILVVATGAMTCLGFVAARLVTRRRLRR